VGWVRPGGPCRVGDCPPARHVLRRTPPFETPCFAGLLREAASVSKGLPARVEWLGAGVRPGKGAV
jgi:hypothetical protein